MKQRMRKRGNSRKTWEKIKSTGMGMRRALGKEEKKKVAVRKIMASPVYHVLSHRYFSEKHCIETMP